MTWPHSILGANLRPNRPCSIAVLALLSVLSLACDAKDFTFSAKNPNFKVTIPNIPPLAMAEHPMRSTRPQLRYLGSDGTYTVSVLAPTAGSGMTATECASSTFRQLSSRAGVPSTAHISRARINERTYLAIYASQGTAYLMLHAHLVSAAAAGTHCIEVHVSKLATSQEDVPSWFNNFGAVNIEPR